jgi:hypothetical protein
MSDSNRVVETAEQLMLLLATVQADIMLMLGEMHETDLTPRQREILARSRKKLRASQTAFSELAMGVEGRN